MGGRAKTDTRIMKRSYEVLQLKLSGASDRAIAAQMGYSHTIANKDWHRALRDLAAKNTPAADELRELQMSRYERLLLTWWTKATATGDPSLQAAEFVLRVLRAISDINGLVAPTISTGDVTVNNIYMLAKAYAQRGAPEAEISPSRMAALPEGVEENTTEEGDKNG